MVTRRHSFFLYILNHAVSQKSIPPETYFTRLPLERVKEIHLSAHGYLDGKWRDLHEKPNNETLKVLQFIWEKLTAEAYLIIEFYKNFEDLVEIYDETSLWIEKSRLENSSQNCWELVLFHMTFTFLVNS